MGRSAFSSSGGERRSEEGRGIIVDVKARVSRERVEREDARRTEERDRMKRDDAQREDEPKERKRRREQKSRRRLVNSSHPSLSSDPPSCDLRRTSVSSDGLILEQWRTLFKATKGRARRSAFER